MSDPSLDAAFLNSKLSRYKNKEAAALIAVQEALLEMSTRGGYLSFSGGKDSTVILHMLTQLAPDTPVCFFETDLEFPENVEYMDTLRVAWGFPLHRVKTKSFLDLFIGEGWFNHYRDSRDMGESAQDIKISAPALQAREKFGDVFLWGMRADESKRRSALLIPTKGITQYNDGRLAIAPLWNWSSIDVSSYLTKHDVPSNPLYKRMQELGVPEKEQRVGSIFDGANIDNGRITWLKRGWSKEYDRLRKSLPRIEEFS